MKKTLIASALLLASSNVLATDSFEINKSIPIQQAQKLYIDVGVGELDVSTYDGDAIKLSVKIEKSRTNWFSSVDIEDAYLEQKSTENKLKFKVDLDNTTQEWTVLVPRYINMNLSLGVGDVEVNDLSSSLRLDVGVGSADVSLKSENYQRIELDSGVGDAVLKGFENVYNRRAVVKKEVDWKGDGEHKINVDVGVGDARVAL